jgi:hypothetical protein
MARSSRFRDSLGFLILVRALEQTITGQQKKDTDIRRRLYQAIVVNIALWEAKAGH